MAVEGADKSDAITALISCLSAEALGCDSRPADAVSRTTFFPPPLSLFSRPPHPAYLHEPVARLADEGEAH